MTDVAAAAAAGDLSFLDETALHDWVVGQRWFGSKAREVTHIDVAEVVPLRAEPPLLVLALVEARFGEGTHETYQLPLGLRPAGEGWSDRVIQEVSGWTVYDALADPDHGRELLQRMRASEDVAVGDGMLRFRWAEGPDAHALRDRTDAAVDVRPIGVEQSNSSVVFGEALILKAFRRIEPGVNPELELLRFLSERGFPHIAPLGGWYEVESRQIDATLGILQEYLADARNGWELVLDGIEHDADGLLMRLHALGAVTGEMHTALSDSADPAFAPDEPSTESLSLLVADIDEQIERLFSQQEEAGGLGPLTGRGQDVRERLQQLSHIGAAGRVIRTHGDYHLGQTMLAGRGWVILDFEGEPARPLPERRRKRSPLRDVAGMLRSFSYAAAAARLQRGVEPHEGWEEGAREAFLGGYRETIDLSLLPPGQQATDQLLALFELEKAIYELRYELNNRPDWVDIPVAGIVRLLDEA
jgi:maltokinase